jgi:hypothetical protein
MRNRGSRRALLPTGGVKHHHLMRASSLVRGNTGGPQILLYNMSTSMISQTGLAPVPKGLLICKGYGAVVHTRMELVFMHRLQSHWRTTVFGHLSSSTKAFCCGLHRPENESSLLCNLGCSVSGFVFLGMYHDTDQSSDWFVSPA